jgi:hypothetical protein
MDKHIAKVQRPASGVAKRGMTEKVVKKTRRAKIVKETTWPLQNNAQCG